MMVCMQNLLTNNLLDVMDDDIFRSIDYMKPHFQVIILLERAKNFQCRLKFIRCYVPIVLKKTAFSLNKESCTWKCYFLIILPQVIYLFTLI